MTLTSTNNSNIPFVALHAHSVAGSPFDALGYPPEHMDYAYENGSTALALTDHGNMNGLSYQVLHAKKMKQEGRDFKPIFGCEAYFIPSIQEWREEYQNLKTHRDSLEIQKQELEQLFGKSGNFLHNYSKMTFQKQQEIINHRETIIIATLEL